MINCGTCTAPQTCGGGGTANVATVRLHAERRCPAGDDCGTIADGCGGMSTAAPAPRPQTCGGGEPATPTQCGCTPSTTCPAGDNCGPVADGCGGTLDCGDLHRARRPAAAAAPPTSAAAARRSRTCPAGANCGTVCDGCGGMLDCGTLHRGQTCGGGGTANVCGSGTGCFQPATCPAGQATAARLSTAAAAWLDCGTCTAPQTCGGGGTAQRLRQHACVPRPTARPAQRLRHRCRTAAAACSTAARAPAADLRRRHAEQPQPVRAARRRPRASPATSAAWRPTAAAACSVRHLPSRVRLHELPVRHGHEHLVELGRHGGSAATTSSCVERRRSHRDRHDQQLGLRDQQLARGSRPAALGRRGLHRVGRGRRHRGRRRRREREQPVGGCGCETVGDAKTSNASLSLFGVLALAGRVRRRAGAVALSNIQACQARVR